jgi:hypothetical protein
MGVIEKFWAPVPWMLETAVIVELALGKYGEAAIILALLVFNAALGFFQESRAQATLAPLSASRAHWTTARPGKATACRLIPNPMAVANIWFRRIGIAPLWNFAPNALSQSNIGILGNEPIAPGRAFVFDLEAGFDPAIFELERDDIRFGHILRWRSSLRTRRMRQCQGSERGHGRRPRWFAVRRYAANV